MDNILPEYRINELPSRFVGYPKGVEIYAIPHTFGSAMNIQMTGRQNVDILSEILSGVKVVGMPKNLLTPQDIVFIGVYRNLMSSKHNKISVKSVCPKCLKETSTVKTLGSIQFKEVENFTADCYPLEVTLNDFTMWFNFVSYKDFKLCLEKFRGDKLYQLALQVVKYKDNETDEIKEKPDYTLSSKESTTVKVEKYAKEVRDILYTMVDEDKDTLEEVINILEDYGLKPITIECSDEHCKNEYTITLEDQDVLVTPFRDSQKSVKSRIRLSNEDVDRSDMLEANESEGSGTPS